MSFIYGFHGLFSVRGKFQKLLVDFVHPKLILLVMHLISLSFHFMITTNSFLFQQVNDSDRAAFPTDRNCFQPSGVVSSGLLWCTKTKSNFVVRSCQQTEQKAAIVYRIRGSLQEQLLCSNWKNLWPNSLACTGRALAIVSTCSEAGF
ncbi:hypothetical protein POTOM_021257 [Populus tomentosa]|uniref:Uncharacterized protein n=1 Tax=Populus tomentosa TaxID=118781 RepID=A0A8X7ZX62_POPTO|nr:hypothetical protein POTOM_021257 [Populus tomentosa]